MKNVIKGIALAIAVMMPGAVVAQNAKVYDTVLHRFQTFFNSSKTDSIYTMLSPRSQVLLPREQTQKAMTDLLTQAGELDSFRFAKFEGDLAYYKASFRNFNLTLMTTISAEKKLDAFRFVPYQESIFSKVVEKSNIALPTTTGTIYGTMVMPASATKVPVVLIIAGSGPTDRDCNNTTGMATNAYKMLADSLLAAGIGSVRYDKRGIGESTPALAKESDVDFNTYVSDAVGFITMIARDNRVSEVIVAGHSEGSLLGMLAAQKAPVKKYISISGAGERIDKIIFTQIDEQSKELAAASKLIMDSLRAGNDVHDVPQPLQALFRPSIQPFMKAWLKYDPQAELKKLTIPVLIIQGRNDLQVSAENAEKLAKANPKAKLVMFDDMNHVLKNAPKDKEGNFKTYSNSELPLTPGLSKAIIKFIKS